MKWSEIKNKYPDKFILIGDIVEKKISANQYKVVAGKVIKVCDDGKEIMKAYQQYKKRGMDVLYAFPNTTNEFIIENVPFMGIL